MQELKTTIKLKCSYAGLSNVVGGKMWRVDNTDVNSGELFGSLYFTTKREAVAAVRQIYKADPNFRNAVLNQINECRGRAYFLN